MPFYIDKKTKQRVEGWCWHVAQKEFPAWVQELFDTGTINRVGGEVVYDGDKYYSGCFLVREPLGICNLQSFKKHFDSVLRCKVKRARADKKVNYFNNEG